MTTRVYHLRDKIVKGARTPPEATLIAIRNGIPAFLVALCALRPLAAAVAEPPMPRPEKRGKPSAGRDLIQWVTIPGGSFLMGSEINSDEKPRHRVSVPEFQMAKSEVTQKQYKACIDAGACTPPSCEWPPDPATESLPVLCVDWNQARAFSAWVGGRLPSEAEWEYAARSAGQERPYPWGEGQATCATAVVSGCGGGAAPVCSKPAGHTRQGLCDMAGNAWEWTQDSYHESYQRAPAHAGAWESPAGPHRVRRGGSWNDRAGCARSSYRDLYDLGERTYDVGFRPARPR